MDINDGLARFQLQLIADGRSPHTQGQYRRHVQTFGRWLDAEGASKDLGAINHTVVAEFMASRAAQLRPDGTLKKPCSLNTLRTSLRCFFGYLHAAGITAENPARLLRRAMCGPPPPRTLSDGDQEKLMKVLAEAKGKEARRDHALFGLLLASGLRVSAALASDVEDLDLERAELRIRSAKGNRPRTVILGRKAVDLLTAYLDGRQSGPLFRGPNARAITSRHAQRRFRMWAEAAGIRGGASTHSLRHSFADGLYQRTGDLGLVRAALGHRSIASTMVYAHASTEKLRMELR